MLYLLCYSQSQEPPPPPLSPLTVSLIIWYPFCFDDFPKKSTKKMLSPALDRNFLSLNIERFIDSL